MKKIIIFSIITIMIGVFSCKEKSPIKNIALNAEIEKKTLETEIITPQFTAYWYKGEAEISSYKLEQARYGEIRDGKAVLIYVTEDFLENKQVKADKKSSKSIPVLKLNATKNFNTGIYPYSIMQSTFYPVSNNQHALKVSSSIQEWCGHVYTQLNNRNQFEINSHSYFESEADENFKLDKQIIENELWTQLRINPESLPTGKIQVIPSLEFLRLRHIPLQAYHANAILNEGAYTLIYPELNRTLKINFNTNFPFDILSWEESYKNGFDSNAKIMITKATKLKTIKSPYWYRNSNKYEVLRDTLHLN